MCCPNNILRERQTAILQKSRLARNKQRTFQKFITRHYRLKTVPKVYQPVYNMFRFMKIVIFVIFTVYKPEKQVDVSTGTTTKLCFHFSEIRLVRNQKCPSTIEFRTAKHFGSALPFPSTNALSHNKYLLPVPTTILDRNN